MEIVFATNNPNKIKEVSAIMPSNIRLLSLSDIGCNEDIPETMPTIEGNALQKARYVFDKYGYNCFADDTGLEVEALNNEPGVYSARYAGKDKDASANMKKVLEKLSGIDNRNARFKTVVALIVENEEHLFEGIINGTILAKATGTDGFGYDPIFSPGGYDITFAEMAPAEKNKISHRALAIKKLGNYLNK